MLGGCSFITAGVHTRPQNSPRECSNYTLPGVDTIIATGLLAGGTYAAIDSRDANDSGFVPLTHRDVELGAAIALLAAGALTAGSAAFGYVEVPRCRRETRMQREQLDEADRREQQRRLRQRQAWSKTQAAAQAARDGDCATVTNLDGVVRALDLDFHDSVFMRDAAISRCLAP